jgi:hypothetical protein
MPDQTNNDKETARILAVKGAIQATMATAGWTYIKEMCDNAVAIAINAALDETDKEKRDFLTIKASAMRDGFKNVFTAIETLKAWNGETSYEVFGELEPSEFQPMEL